MKSVITILLFLFACNFGYAQCSGPTAPPNGSTNTYTISSSFGQCGSCYDWDVSNGNAQILGSDMGNSAQIRRNGTGAYTITVNYLNEGGCQSCTINIPSLTQPCNFIVSINDQYLLGLNGTVGISANTAPQVGPGATYFWTFTYQNFTTYSTSTTTSVVLVPATTSNPIVSATLTVSYLGCTKTITKLFPTPIPESGGFGKVHGGGGNLNLPASEQKFKLFPNPVSDEIQIEGAERDRYSISIYDVNGKFVLQNVPLSSEINLEASEPGVYMYLITDENGFHQEGKIVKQ